MDETRRRPFHVTIVKALDRSSSATGLTVLVRLIKETMIRKDHDAIIAAWERNAKRIGLNGDYGVVENLLLQKQGAEDIKCKEGFLVSLKKKRKEGK